MTIIEKIRAEIERRMQRFESRIEEYKDTPFTRIVDVNKIRLDECTQILHNIDTIQEQPICEGLDYKNWDDLLTEEMAKVYETYTRPSYIEENSTQASCHFDNYVARHFYNLGRQSKEQPLGEDFDLESDRFFRKLPLDEYIYEETFDRIARHFAKWGAEHLNK